MPYIDISSYTNKDLSVSGIESRRNCDSSGPKICPEERRTRTGEHQKGNRESYRGTLTGLFLLIVSMFKAESTKQNHLEGGGPPVVRSVRQPRVSSGNGGQKV